MKIRFSDIIANDDICDYFAGSIKANSLSHAYILLGSAGTGKHTLSRLIAAAINCESKNSDKECVPCGKCNSCQKILSGNSVDVRVISREQDKATLGIEAIRFIKEDVAFYPNDGDYKIYIIEDAHTMTTQAQNAFLLTLEEPPQYAIFMLLCEHTESILETIKSRAPVLRMRTPTKEQAIEYLRAHHPSVRTLINSNPEEFEQIYIASNGSIGRIIQLAGSNERKQILQSRELTQKLIVAITGRTVERDFAEISSLLSQKRDERERIISQLSEIQTALRDLLVIKKADEPTMTFFTDRKYAEELSYSISSQRIINIMEQTEKARISLLRNANVKLTVMNYLSGLI